FFGPSWPAVVPSVVGVGGTSLHVKSSQGAYGSERGWRGSGGGFSSLESEPTYQYGVQSTGGGTRPDVADNADPDSGFLVYPSVPLQGQSGWFSVGGTSAGAPQWAALVAIANQGRALAGKGSLDGFTQTLPALYSVNRTAAFTSDFHDVTGGGNGYASRPGYDLVTGLGSPQAGSLLPFPAGAAATAATRATASSTATAASTSQPSGKKPSGVTAAPVDRTGDSSATLSTQDIAAALTHTATAPPATGLSNV